ncbi:hypothetical protein [Methylobacterium pseudosasicola]|uniref:Uncharacterized protein n=1 Tax=Methylobacterium pseudosasicola TaxID=582667 RepID=A0A1I4UEY3_9HYPH|nr:hypothetical protein [Methylobacterium pseudosasicola]SFM87528.1 hypothetical protein SAMN05192568_10694 [Methylobacterium pseudosasicola]
MARPILSATPLVSGAGILATPATALSAKDCAVNYQAAKQGGTLNGQKWGDFRKAECGAAPEAATNTVPNSMVTGAAKPTPTSAAARSTAAYPSAVDPKYAKESAGKARMHTCLESYHAAKAAGTLGDAKWIQIGGGYCSVCNMRPKG